MSNCFHHHQKPGISLLIHFINYSRHLHSALALLNSNTPLKTLAIIIEWLNTDLFSRNLTVSICLQFARHCAHFTAEDRMTLIWTDEISIKVGMQCSTRDWTWRRDNEGVHLNCIDYRKHACQYWDDVFGGI